MMARSTTRSNQRPDTLMQDRICQVDETSCNARPDHTSGSNSDLVPRPSEVCSSLNSGHAATTSVSPFPAQEQQQSCSISATTHAACFSSGLRCVVSENVVMSFGRHVASEAGLMQCFVARFAVLEVTESPAARSSVLF